MAVVAVLLMKAESRAVLTMRPRGRREAWEPKGARRTRVRVCSTLNLAAAAA
jgi:hypothetical protein